MAVEVADGLDVWAGVPVNVAVCVTVGDTVAIMVEVEDGIGLGVAVGVNVRVGASVAVGWALPTQVRYWTATQPSTDPGKSMSTQ